MVITLSHCLVVVRMNNRHACPKPQAKVGFGDEDSFGNAAQMPGPLRAAKCALAGGARWVSLHSGLLRGLKSARVTRGGTP